MKHTRSGVVAALFALAFLVLGASATHASNYINAVQVTASYSTTNDQTALLATTTANVPQVKASRTLTIGSIPTASTTSTFGTCVITYSTTTPDSLNCAGNTAILNVTTHNSTTTIATTLGNLTNLRDTGHGALSAATSTNTVTFTTAGTEASATPITFSDTSGVVTSTASTTGVVPVAEVLRLNIGGTVDPGDTFSVTLPTGGAVTYTTLSSDTTLQNIANGLNSAIQATSSYASQLFTTSTTTNAVLFTAKTAGTGFNLATSTTNGSSVAQVVTFTPTGVSGATTFSITINSNTHSYTYTGGDTQNITSGLASAAASDPAVNCSASATALTCTAKTPGTSFTYGSTGMVVGTQRASGSSWSGGLAAGSSAAAQHASVTKNSTSNAGVSTAKAPAPAPGAPAANSQKGAITNTATTPVKSSKAPSAQTPVASVGTSATNSATPTPKNPATPVANGSPAPASPSGSTASVPTSLGSGSRNASVVKLQTLLSSDPSLGYKANVTGYYGKATQTAVTAFQKKYNLTQTGTVDTATRAMLTKVFGS